MTEIREPNYRMDLPGEWAQGQTLEEATVLYRDVEGTDTVSVMLLGVNSVYAIANPKMLLDQYMDHRRTFEQGHGAFQQSAPTSAEEGGTAAGGWDGHDPENGRRVRHYVVLTGSLLADFRFVAFGLSEDEFERRATQIFESVEVVPPAE